MKQAQYAPMQVAEMAVTLFTINKGYFDDIDVKRALAFEAALHQTMRQKHADLMGKIDSSKDLDADAEKALDAAVLEFKKTWA
jgi:F-type H+/Na+-transporting ATPase subunit alpha